MARKVFLSVLGTSFYRPCYYVKGAFKSSKVSFVQQAALELFNQEQTWVAGDKIIIALTDKAKSSNWDRSITIRKDFDKIEKPYVGLEQILIDMGLESYLAPISIPSGENNEEIWTIFTRIYEELQEGDELYFDITHSFRYLPMVLLVLCNYAKFLKKIKIRNIVYGNYEARQQDTNEAPLLDLLPLTILQDWTFAAADFIHNGQADELYQLSNDDMKRIRKEYAEKRGAVSSLNQVVKQFYGLTLDLQLCQGKSLLQGKNLNNSKLLMDESASELIAPLTPILEKIKESVSAFSENNDYYNLIAGATWCLEKRLYQQSITLLKEGIITYYCHLLGKDVNVYDINLRDLVSGYLSCKARKSVWKSSPPQAVYTQILESFEFPADFLVRYSELTDVRNYINHAAMRKSVYKSDSLKDAIERLVTYFDACLHENQIMVHNQVSSIENLQMEPKEKLLINLTHFPYESWEEKQKEVSKLYGKCVDLKFPLINSDIDELGIGQLIEKYLNEILFYTENYEVTVLIMGEMTFCFQLITRLKALQIPCISSCVTLNSTEEITSSFNSFRHY